MSSLFQRIKKDIPYRKIIRGIDSIQRLSSSSLSRLSYLKSWCAMKAGLWRDQYFLNVDEILHARYRLEHILLSIHYKRLKSGWSADELNSLSVSRSYALHSRQPLFNALLASLFLEIGDRDHSLQFLKTVRATPAVIDGYLGLTALAIDHNLPLSLWSQQHSQQIRTLFSGLESFSAFFTPLLRNRKVAIIGNGMTEISQAKGNHIDSHDEVFRFNNFPLHSAYEKDYGKKYTIWVRTPSVDEVAIRMDIHPQIILFSGSLLKHVKNGHWKWMLQYCYQDLKLVLFDDFTFRYLVQMLHAPPSSGILTAFSLCKLSPRPTQLNFFGFDFNSGIGNHYFDNDKATSRHEWSAERKIFSSILEETSGACR